MIEGRPMGCSLLHLDPACQFLDLFTSLGMRASTIRTRIEQLSCLERTNWHRIRGAVSKTLLMERMS